MGEMTVPLVDRGNGLWGSSSPAWDHLIDRESSGRPTIIQQIHDVNSGGNEAEGLFQITPKTWRAHNGTDFAPSARLATPQQQAIVAARIFTRNPTGSDWGAGRPGRESASDLQAGLVPLGGAPAPVQVPYGMPNGSNSGGYGNGGVKFPDWVYALGNAFGLKPSTYPGHQESDRNEAGYAPNPAHLNRGIDWAAPGASDEVARMQRFADYLFSIRGELEQVIWWNPADGRRIGVAGGKDVTNTPYYDYPGGYDDHRNHVHTRQSHSIPIPGGAPAPPPPVSGPWTGDPVWLADVLRAEGVTVIEEPGWRDSGHGDMGSLWGVINHHTGSNNSTWESIRNGREDLAGPLAHIHLRRDGVAEIVAVGVCWHAGTGNYADLGRGAGNQRTIGIESQNDGGGTPGKPHRSSWPDVQYDALVKINAAIDRRLGVGASHSISHQEYDKGDPPTFEGKWDPGALDMNIFRADVAARIASAPPTQGDDELSAEDTALLRAMSAKIDRLDAEWTAVKQGPTRSFMAPDQKPVDSPLGFLYNIDGNVWNITVTFAYLFGVKRAEEFVNTVAQTGVAPDSWAGELTDEQGHWLAEWGQQWCIGLISFRAAILKALLAINSGNLPTATPGVNTVTTPVVSDSVVQAVAGQAAAAVSDKVLAGVQAAVFNAMPPLVPAAQEAQVGVALAVVEPDDVWGKLAVLGRSLESVGLADALPVEQRAPLAALLSIIQTKNGSTL